MCQITGTISERKCDGNQIRNRRIIYNGPNKEANGKTAVLQKLTIKYSKQ